MKRGVSTAAKAHLAIEVAIFGALLAWPILLRPSARRYALVPVLLGATGLCAALMSRMEWPMEGADRFRPSRELSEAVADPDIARTPHLRSHLE